jgi:hypothetical protein
LRRILIFLSLGLQVLLGVSPFIPWVKANIWSSQTSVNSFAATLATYVGLQFVCLGGLVALFLFDLAEQSKESTNRFRHLLGVYTPLQARRLKEGEFYKEFLGECVKANHYAKICYFSPVPPDHGAPAARKLYYRRLIKVMKANPAAQFKRIIRDTDANREWADEIIPFVMQTANFSLALLKDVDATEEMPLALSVQIIDERIAWLVAVAEHTDADLYRDVAVENEIVVEVLNKYFDRLWRLSRPVFRPGYTVEQAHRAIFEEE